jgi:ribonuclease HI
MSSVRPTISLTLWPTTCPYACLDLRAEPPDPGCMTDTIEIWTDGACSGNPGPGGWGVVIRSGGKMSELYGGEPGTTNNRMEMMAAIKALESAPDGSSVILHTDSQYVKDGLTKWIIGWKRNGWKTASKDPVKNQDLWQRLDAANQKHKVDWRWVKGHAGDAGNERADTLARRGCDEARGRK